MRPSLLADTGSIVAFLHADDQHHAWAVSQFENRPLPFLTCDAVLTEATYLLAREGLARRKVPDLVTTGALAVAFDTNEESEAVAELLTHCTSFLPQRLDGVSPRRPQRLVPDHTQRHG